MIYKATWPSGYGAGFRSSVSSKYTLRVGVVYNEEPQPTCSKERGFESLSCHLTFEFLFLL